MQNPIVTSSSPVGGFIRWVGKGVSMWNMGCQTGGANLYTDWNNPNKVHMCSDNVCLLFLIFDVVKLLKWENQQGSW